MESKLRRGGTALARGRAGLVGKKALASLPPMEARSHIVILSLENQWRRVCMHSACGSETSGRGVSHRDGVPGWA